MLLSVAVRLLGVAAVAHVVLGVLEREHVRLLLAHPLLERRLGEGDADGAHSREEHERPKPVNGRDVFNMRNQECASRQKHHERCRKSRMVDGFLPLVLVPPVRGDAASRVRDELHDAQQDHAQCNGVGKRQEKAQHAIGERNPLQADVGDHVGKPAHGVARRVIEARVFGAEDARVVEVMQTARELPFL